MEQEVGQEPSKGKQGKQRAQAHLLLHPETWQTRAIPLHLAAPPRRAACVNNALPDPRLTVRLAPGLACGLAAALLSGAS